MWEYFCSLSVDDRMSVVIFFIIGSVFLITGALKVLYSRPFITHVRNLRILPHSLSAVAASLFIQLECGIGMALILSIFTAELIPVLIGLILSLSILSAWGVISGRVEDCGCYGGWLSLTLGQSLGLNFLYLVLLVIGWRTLEVYPPVLMWKVWIILGIFILCNFLIRRSANVPLIDVSPVQPGRKWRTKWLDSKELGIAPESRLVIFINSRCQQCKHWEPYILNLLGRENLPAPLLVIPDRVKDPGLWDEKIPLKMMNSRMFRYLVYQTPTAVLVKNGVIENKWVAHFPEEYI